MNKQDIYHLLQETGRWFEVTEHEAVYNMEEAQKVELPYPEYGAKTLFVRDDKKSNYYLISVKGEKRVDLKEFRKENQTRHLSFASKEELKNILGLIPGAVTPLGILNDEEAKVRVFLDRDFFDTPEGLIGVHPNDNTATVWMKAEDLVNIIKENGNEVKIVEL